MGYRDDLVNGIRRSTIPQLHYLLEGTFGAYAVSHTTADEYVMTAHCSEADLEAALEELGFSRNPIAAVKVRLDGNTADGSWVYRDAPHSSHQLHVILHALEDRPNCVDVYAHWETSWIRHPYRHYTKQGYDAETGVALTRRLLTERDFECLDGDLSYEVDTGLERRVSEHLSVSYYWAKDRWLALRSWLPLLDGDGYDSHVTDRENERDTVSPRITNKF
ncbi:hypothetical protein ACLI4Y_04620 [Natrialbaceae archaeon A-CW3]